MTALKFIDRIERLHLLIQRKGTGTPSELARRLELSESTIYQYINTLKLLGAPLTYDHFRQSYVYEKRCTLNLRYHIQALEENEITHTQAGFLSTCYFVHKLAII